MLLAASILNYLGINFMTKSNQLGSPVTVAIILYIQVFYNYVADLIFFKVNFTYFEYLGLAITVGFSLMAACIKFIKERKK